MSKSRVREIIDRLGLEEGEGIQLKEKLHCFQCGRRIRYDENKPGNGFAITATFMDPETGGEYDDFVCIECAIRINKETDGDFLGVDSIDDLDLSDEDEEDDFRREVN